MTPTIQSDVIRPVELAQRLDISIATLWRRDRAQLLPAACRPVRGSVYWIRAEVNAWIAAGTPSRSRWAKMQRSKRCA